MIGVLVNEPEREVARELFELLKTPWEFFVPQGRYSAVLDTTGQVLPTSCRLVMTFSSANLPGDQDRWGGSYSNGKETSVLFEGASLPIYGRRCGLGERGHVIMRWADGVPAACHVEIHRQHLVRVGYDILGEIEFLCRTGQPAQNSTVPTLELHLQLLRNFLVSAGISFVEVPPVPSGYRFAVSLTHDVDHPLMRNHRFDRTFLGFFYRATVDSAHRWIRGRMGVGQLMRNLKAAALSPLVPLRWAPDPWQDFDAYLELDGAKESTFFVLPEGGYAGQNGHGPAPALRAARYSLDDIRPQLRRIRKAGAEIGLHGIDAWRDEGAARREQVALAQESGTDEMGIRMHWLYYGEETPGLLDKAGFTYDSTFGYCETAGFRAGTGQVFRPAGAARLLELPLTVMDTALFYPVYLNLDESQAAKWVENLVGSVERFGGVLVLNWHDRSIRPERLWDDFYRRMLAGLRAQDAWLASAGQVVEWFRLRREVRFEEVSQDSGRVRVIPKLTPGTGALPGLRLRIHEAPTAAADNWVWSKARTRELALEKQTEISITT